MRNILTALIFGVCLLGVSPEARGQSAPAFDVASVKTSPPAKGFDKGGPRASIESTPGTLTMRNVSLRACIRWAYGVKDYQISGPAWLGSEMYDIVGKAAGPAPEAELRLMLQALLADRFKLVLHREPKELPVYALVAGKNGPKLEAAKTAAPANMSVSGGNLVFQNTTMAELADRLSIRPFGLDHPVLDKTGLTGGFDFTAKLADNIADLKRSLERGEQDPSTYTASLSDLGLKLEGQKSRLEILVIDHADKLPAEN